MVPYKRVFAWVLEDVERFVQPFTYNHRQGAVIWATAWGNHGVGHRNFRRPASATGAVVQRAETRAGLGNTSTERADKIMDELRALGHYPKGAAGYEYNLHKRISRARKARDFSTVQIEEIEALP